MISKFKKGNRVKVLRASTQDEEHKWSDVWIPDMDRFVGKWCIIDYVNDSTCCGLYIEGGNCKYFHTIWNFPAFVLAKTEVEQQLEFDFMKE